MNTQNKELLARVQEHIAKRRTRSAERMWALYANCQLMDRPLLLTILRPRFWAKFLNFDWDAKSSPDARISFFLRIELARLENIIDDSLVNAPVIYPPYVDLERKGGTNILGGWRKYDPATGSFIDMPLISSKAQLDKLQMPEPCFRQISRQDELQYAEYVGCVEGLLDVKPPDSLPLAWDPVFSPFGGACKMIGHEDLLIYMHDDPAFVHAVMEWLCQARIAYDCKRAAMLGHDVKKNEKEWAEDDVNFPFISRNHYEDFVYPYECRAAASIGNIHYHSCGNITPFADLIAAMPEIVQIDVGAESDLKTVAALVRGRKIRLRKSPHVMKEVLHSDENSIRKLCRNIINESAGTSNCLLCEGFYDGARETFSRVIEFSRIAYDELTNIGSVSI